MTLVSTSVTSTSNFHVQAIKQVGKSFPLTTAVAFPVSSVLSRLDYGNSLLCSFPASVYSWLQPLQSHAVNIVFQAVYFSFSRTCLHRLPFLPPAQRSNFKLIWLVENLFATGQSTYLHDFLSVRHPNESLRSSKSGSLMHQPVFSNLFAHRFFSILPLTYKTLFYTSIT